MSAWATLASTGLDSVTGLAHGPMHRALIVANTALGLLTAVSSPSDTTQSAKGPMARACLVRIT